MGQWSCDGGSGLYWGVNGFKSVSEASLHDHAVAHFQVKFSICSTFKKNIYYCSSQLLFNLSPSSK